MAFYRTFSFIISKKSLSTEYAHHKLTYTAFRIPFPKQAAICINKKEGPQTFLPAISTGIEI